MITVALYAKYSMIQKRKKVSVQCVLGLEKAAVVVRISLHLSPVMRNIITETIISKKTESALL
jgi:hypothetical protein